MRRIVLAAALALFLCSAAGAAEPVRLLTGFEWEEYAGKLPRWVYLGKPYLQEPAAGWKGEEITKAEDVGPDGFQIINGAPSSSRHQPGALMVPAHATQGRFAWKCTWGATRWAWIVAQLKSKAPGPWPVHEQGYDIYDHLFQRETQLWRRDCGAEGDWSGYERLRFDVTAVGAPVKVGFRVRDASGPSLPPGPTGIRTAVAVFTIPADKAVSCDVPLAELARISELDLSKIHRYNIRLNGLPDGKAPAELYIDNIRLVAKDGEPKPALPLVSMEGKVEPFARAVFVKEPTVRVAERLVREAGPVEPLGPVVINSACLHSAGAGHMEGHFGGSGATYFQNARRAIVAYDNKRLLVVMAGSEGTAARKGPRPRGGLVAIASLDGGQTWAGLKPEDKGFTVLPWFLRSGFFADRYGDVYGVGTPNCDSYNEGQDICVHRLAFTGETWVDDRFATIHQDGYKCPQNCQAIRLESGRIWAAWGDGFGGHLARFSDDDGFTWQPCKDAALDPPRPFHAPKLQDLGKADAPKPPKSVLLWPSSVVPGQFLVPYKGGVAVFSTGGMWAFHSGEAWAPGTPKGPKATGLLSVTVLGDDRVFLSFGAGHSDLGKEVLAKEATVARLDAGEWKTDVLDSGDIGSTILTASGDAVFCFYVKKPADREGEYDIFYRRWKAGAWEQAVKAATEKKRINHLAAPQFSPPDYAAIFWDQHFEKREDPSEVKFLRVPNK